MEFSYQEAFSRNLGWLTSSEFEILKNKKVAIAGTGGVGGHYCEVLTRLGIQNFHIADLDVFEVVNFNRQNSSGIKTLGRPKVQVLKEKILDINPNANVTCFENGVNQDNLESFLKGVDLYIDGLDFFVLDERYHLFKRLRELQIPGITIGPVGAGASLIAFTPDSMSFEDYFGFIPSMSEVEKAARFLVGLSPTGVHRSYMVDPTRLDLINKKAPSLPMGCFLCGGVGGTMALKILLKRGEIKAAPWNLHFDAYKQVYKKSYIWWGAKNPKQRLIMSIVKKQIQEILNSQSSKKS